MKIEQYKAQDYMEIIAKTIEDSLNDDCIVIFFGSILDKRFNRTSDIDVAIFCKKAVSDSKFLKLMEELERLPILRKIDLINLNKLEDLELAKEIVNRGRIWKNIPELSEDLKKHLKNSGRS